MNNARTRMLILGLIIASLMVGAVGNAANRASMSQPVINLASESTTDAVDQSPAVSHRLIVQLASPSLSEAAAQQNFPRLRNGKVDVTSFQASLYKGILATEQKSFVDAMSKVVPGANVASYINEHGQAIQASYKITFNGVSIDPGSADPEQVRAALAKMPGVKAVYRDFAHRPDMYASLSLINAPAAWTNSAIGGQQNAGRGIKVASMDGGVHKDAAMFDGTGYSYPPNFPANGLGLTENNNGKIIASRAYFRSWDPPAAGDENPWPGENGTSHGVHTAGTAAGNQITADYHGLSLDLSGVAPAAWVMSYRVFYASVSNNGSFYTTEGLAALEDIVADGADVLNNSWGSGPTSSGGEHDPLDTALINAASSGIFVSMSAGNSGPGAATTDHPSGDYINVAATSTSGTIASGRLRATAPEPVTDDLKSISYAAASFGAPLPPNTATRYSYVAAANVNPNNRMGCTAWPAETFTGQAVLIERGSCEFGVKVLNAERGGATFVVVYNSIAGGDALTSMGAGTVGAQVTISSVFVGRTKGLALVNWQAQNPTTAELEMNTLPFLSGNTPDVVASFSSRGPGVGNVLKPDIAAPGVNIMSQGYASGAEGEARHLGYGQASGTSMAAPHVAGAAALLRQIHPSWSNAYIKSALMSTSKYMDIWNHDGTPAQPLDIGAGRLDLTHAANPGVMLSPPSLSYGLVATDTMKTIRVELTSVADAAETYDLRTLYTGAGFAITQTTALPGFTVSPSSVTLAPGETTVISVTFDANTSRGVGDNQGYIILDGAQHDAHMPAWARVTPSAPAADILVIDNDASRSYGLPDYSAYYTSTLDALGYSYAVWDTGLYNGQATTIPHPAVLSGYKTIIYFTGDNWLNDSFTPLDQNRLAEYANGGGIIIAMGQDMAAVLDSASTNDGTFFYDFILGANYLQDSVTGGAQPTAPVRALPGVPAEFAGLSLNMAGKKTNTVNLVGANEVPPVATTTSGTAALAYNVVSRRLEYTIQVKVTEPVTLTAAHIDLGAQGVSGGVLYPLPIPGAPVVVTNTLTFDGAVNVSEAHDALVRSGGLYINVHSTRFGGGEIRGQLVPALNGDGAGNQKYIDEISTHKASNGSDPGSLANKIDLLYFPTGSDLVQDGVVAKAHRAQPSLEIPGITYHGRSVYAGFGLEGVNEGLGGTTRAQLLQRFLSWAWDEPAATIADTTGTGNASNLTTFKATVTSASSGASYRWDFGDGTPFAGPFTSNFASHTYQYCGDYTVRAEVTDKFGNKTISSLPISVTQECELRRVYLPMAGN